MSNTRHITTSNLINNLLLSYQDKDNYVFRGENKDYGKVSSNLYRQYHKEGKDDNTFILKTEEYLIDEEKKHFSSHTPNIEVLTELQHYGGKTCLLDFTRNMYIALFFACNCEGKENGRIILFKNKSKEKTNIDYESKDDDIVTPVGKNRARGFSTQCFCARKKRIFRSR